MSDLEILVQLKTALLTALLADAATPFGTYSIDGQSVSRDRYHQWALDFINVINMLIQVEDPYEIRTSVI